MASRTGNNAKSRTEGRSKKSAAGTGKKGSSGASAGGKKGSGRKASQVQKTVPDLYEREKANPEIMQEAVIWLVLALCIFSFISYFGIGGYVGSVISDVSFGLFGVMAYLLPVLVFLAAAFLISNRGNQIVGFKLLSSAGLYLCICSLMELMVNGYQPEVRIDKLYSDSAALKTGGGAVGGAVCSLFCPALGTAGAGIMIAILAVICLVILTQKSLFAGMRHQGERVYQSAQASKVKREIRQQERMQQAEDARRQKEEERLRRQQEKEQRLLQQKEREQQRRASSENPLGDVTVVLPQYAQTESQMWAEPSQGRKRKKDSSAEKRKTAGENVPKTASEEKVGLEIPVIFPSQPRERRMEHRVTGMTPDTWIGEDTPETVASETKKSRTRRKNAGKASVSAFPGSEDETCYISLDRAEQEEPGRVLEQEASSDGEELPLPRVRISGLTHEEPVCDERHQEPEEEVLQEEQGSLDEPNDLKEAYEELPMDDRPEADEEYQSEPEPDNSSQTDSTWPDIWADEADMGRAGTSGTVFSEKRRAGREDVSSAGASKSRRLESSAPGHGDGAQDETAAKQEAHGASTKKNPRSSQQEIQEGIASVEAEAAKAAETVKREYIFPPIDLLKKGKGRSNSGQEQEIRRTAAKLQQTLDSFGVRVTVTDVSCGPAVTRYELQPEQGVKVSRIVSLSDDIKLNLAAADIRIEAPIPGKAAVGIEVPNAENSAVMLRDLLESDEFTKHPSRLAFATGKDIGGKVVVSDIAKMPHLLIAGATGSGKSVCINTLIMSILYKAKPEDVKLIMIDPKVVELSVYNGIPHLFIPVVTDPKKAAGALNWGVAEMTDRYNKFAEFGVRDLKGYNKKVESLGDIEGEDKPKKLPQIVIIVDELADLMMVAPGEVEDSICRLAQLARAAGIHLIIATQRPSVNVITGLIKANMPSRIAFSVSSSVDSRTIIDMGGAEKLLGKGDMLFYPQGYQKPARVQGAFVSDEEVADVVDFLKEQNRSDTFNAEMEQQIARVQQAVSASRGADDVDALFEEAGKFIIEKDKASIGMLQRVFKIGFNRAARIMDQLSEAGVVGPEEGTKPRKILMTLEEFEARSSDTAG